MAVFLKPGETDPVFAWCQAGLPGEDILRQGARTEKLASPVGTGHTRFQETQTKISIPILMDGQIDIGEERPTDIRLVIS